MSDSMDRIVTAVLVVIALLLLAAIIYPFASGLFLAAVLAAAFHPWHERLSRRLRNRPKIGAGIVTLTVVMAMILPVGSLTAILIKEAVEVITFLRQTLSSEGVSGLVEKLPRPLQHLGERLLEALPQLGQQLDSVSAEQGSKAAAAVGGFLSATTNALLQTILMLIAFFFLLLDGRKLVLWLNGIWPSRRLQLVELLTEFRKVSVAVLVSTVVTAGVQALVALVGYLIARVPNSAFFALVTFFIAFVPAVGAASVSLVLAGLLLLGGKIWPAVFLAIWGVVVVGLVDNVVKPILIKGGMELHGAVVFFSLLGGIAVFGPVGIVAGPLIVAFFMAVIRVANQRIDTPT